MVVLGMVALGMVVLGLVVLGMVQVPNKIMTGLKVPKPPSAEKLN